MSGQIFKISGNERRQKKKELSHLKFFVKMFWYFEDLDRVYGGGMEDEKCIKLLAEKQIEIDALEKMLLEKL